MIAVNIKVISEGNTVISSDINYNTVVSRLQLHDIR